MNPKSSLCPVLARSTHFRPMLFTALMGMLLWLASPLARIDDVWSDFLLTCQETPVEGEVILIAITVEDVLAHGQERLSRKFLAETLNILNSAGVRRILLDFNLGSGVTPDEEQQLKAAMMALGPDKLAIAYEPDPIMRTKPSLLMHATPVDLSFTPDTDGRMRTLNNSSIELQPNPCAWLSEGKVLLESTMIDRRIAPNSVPKFDLTSVHQHKFPEGYFRDKMVVISHDRKLAKTRAQLPIHGRVDRGTIIAMATESHISGYNQRAAQADFVSMLANILLIFGGYLIGAQAPNVKRALWGIFWVVTLAITISWNLCVFYGVPSRPGTIMLTSVLALYIALAYRLKVLELIGGLLSGVLSPEEVWLWRVYGEKKSPVVLFDAMGHIKRANLAAIEAFGITTEHFKSQTSPLARQAMPNIGERSGTITLPGKTNSIWKVDWPSNSLPLAVFDDITSHQEEIIRLQTQLYTDPMTGEANRAGFENALKNLDVESVKGYTLIFMDMNGFKAVNDTYGHEAGDILLKVAGQRFRKVIGPEATLARLGGDEFAIIIRDLRDSDSILQLRDQLEASLGAEIDIGQCTVKVGVAAGFATQSDTNEDSASVLRRADHAMYDRKAFIKSRPSTTSLPSNDRSNSLRPTIVAPISCNPVSGDIPVTR